MEIAPDGKHLYTPLTNDLVEQLGIGDGGFLAYMTPATVAAGALPRYAAVSPDGKQLYSTNESGPSVSQFDIASDGKLTAKTTASVAAGTTVSGIAVTPNQGPVATFSAAPGRPEHRRSSTRPPPAIRTARSPGTTGTSATARRWPTGARSRATPTSRRAPIR